MAKRVQEEVKIMNWFQTAPWAAAKTVGNLVGEILKNRKATEEPAPTRAASSKRKTRKSPALAAPAAAPEAAAPPAE